MAIYYSGDLYTGFSFVNFFLSLRVLTFFRSQMLVLLRIKSNTLRVPGNRSPSERCHQSQSFMSNIININTENTHPQMFSRVLLKLPCVQHTCH